MLNINLGAQCIGQSLSHCLFLQRLTLNNYRKAVNSVLSCTFWYCPPLRIVKQRISLSTSSIIHFCYNALRIAASHNGTMFVFTTSLSCVFYLSLRYSALFLPQSLLKFNDLDMYSYTCFHVATNVRRNFVPRIASVSKKLLRKQAK